MPVCDIYRTENCVSYNVRQKDCNCLALCSFIRYKYGVIKNKFILEELKSHIEVTMRWRDSEFYAMKRHQQFRFVDLLSYFGGILGLFAGISVLSIVEIFYFLTLRLINDLFRFCRQ